MLFTFEWGFNFSSPKSQLGLNWFAVMRAGSSKYTQDSSSREATISVGDTLALVGDLFPYRLCLRSPPATSIVSVTTVISPHVSPPRAVAAASLPRSESVATAHCESGPATAEGAGWRAPDQPRSGIGIGGEAVGGAEVCEGGDGGDPTSPRHSSPHLSSPLLGTPTGRRRLGVRCGGGQAPDVAGDGTAGRFDDSLADSTGIAGGTGTAGGTGMAGGNGTAGGTGMAGGNGTAGGTGMAGGNGTAGGTGMAGGNGTAGGTGMAGGNGTACGTGITVTGMVGDTGMAVTGMHGGGMASSSVNCGGGTGGGIIAEAEVSAAAAGGGGSALQRSSTLKRSGTITRSGTELCSMEACSICLGDAEPKAVVDCGHEFCTPCILRWAKVRSCQRWCAGWHAWHV